MTLSNRCYCGHEGVDHLPVDEEGKASCRVCTCQLMDQGPSFRDEYRELPLPQGPVFMLFQAKPPASSLIPRNTRDRTPASRTHDGRPRPWGAQAATSFVPHAEGDRCAGCGLLFYPDARPVSREGGLRCAPCAAVAAS